MTEASFIGVDWGTTNLRAWLIDASGEALDERSSSQGMGSLKPDEFAPAFAKLVAGWPDLPALACGMVGARQGWIEAPYATAPASASDLSQGLVSTPSVPRLRIIPGVAARDSEGRLVNVMRGEETQAIGAAAEGHGVLICPGTHSKWIKTEQGRIKDFLTFMTGELNAVLGEHSVLRHSVGEGASPGSVFRQAVRDVLDGAPLTSELFSVRTGTLDERYSAAESASRLSGLLIGSEVAAGLKLFRPRQATIVGTRGLSAFYEAALNEAGVVPVAWLDGGAAVRRGLTKIWNAL